MPSTASTVGVTMRLPVSNGLQIYRLRTGMEPRPSALDIAIDIFRQPGRIRGGLVAVIGPNAAEHAAEISRILGSHEFDNVGLTPVVVSRQDVVTTSDGLEIAVRRRHDPVAGWIDGVLDENGLGDGSWELYVGYHLPIGSSSVLQEVLTGVPTPAMRREIWQRWTSASNG